MAEQVLRRELAGRDVAVEVGSCGLRTTVPGAAADPRAQAVLAAHGYGYGHSVRQFEPEMFDRHDLIVALDRNHEWVLRQLAPTRSAAARIRLLGSFDPEAGAGWDVPDPVGGDAGDYERTLVLVRAAMPGLIAAILDRG
jgi:protein-tyrosine phosphatase